MKFSNLFGKVKDAFLVIRQIGFPSLFISQSAAETKLPKLLRAFEELVDRNTYGNEDVEVMDWQTN